MNSVPVGQATRSRVITTQSTDHVARAGFPSGEMGLVFLGLTLVAIAAFFWPGLASLPEAWARPEYSHGYLIPPIALFLWLVAMQRESPHLAAAPLRQGLGVVVVALGLAFGLVGNLAQIPDVSAYGFIITLGGLVLVALGTRRGLRYWPAVIYLSFMLPLPNAVYWPLSIKLQLVSSEIGVAIVSLLGIPILLDGNVIDLGVYQLQVSEACSGLRYLFPLVSFGFLFAVLYRGPLWHKALLFLSTIPITIAMNSVRIAVIAVLVERYGIAQAEGFLHFFEGWIIFVACIVVLYLEAVILQRFAATREPLHRMLALDLGGLAAARADGIRSTPALVGVALFISALALAWYAAPARASVTPERDPLVLFPLAVEGWQGRREVLDANIARVLAADDYLSAAYVGPGAAAPVSLFIAYYRSQTEGSGIHSPEVCIPGGGWEVAGWTRAATGLSTADGEPLAVNRAVVRKELSRALVYYWFEQRGRHLTGDYVAKAYTLWDSLIRGRTDGALVRVVTPIEPSETLEAADKRLRGFLGLTLPMLPAYLPG